MEMWTTNTSSSQNVDGNFSNISSHVQLCLGSYNTILDILMLVFNFPVAIYVAVDLLLKQRATLPGNSPSSSQNELLFLHLAWCHLLYYVRVLLNIVQNLGGVTGIRQQYVTAFHGCSLIGSSLFFNGMAIDLYVAVAHPVAYVNKKASKKRIHIFCTFVWIYTVTIGIVTVFFNIAMYHPLIMGSFCASVPVGFTFCVVVLFILHPTGSEKGSQTSSPEKIKQTAIRFMLNMLITLSLYFLPHICVWIFVSVNKADWLHQPCQALPLPLMLTVQIAEFVTALIFFYSTGKLHLIARRCSTICCNIGS